MNTKITEQEMAFISKLTDEDASEEEIERQYLLRFSGQLSYGDISPKMAITQQAARKRIQLARDGLRVSRE